MENIKMKLINKFGYNQPFFADDLKDVFDGYSEKYLYKIINPFINKKEIVRYDSGIYYIPKQTENGVSKLNPIKIIEKKYLKDDKEVFGIYAGLTLLNQLGLTTQVPNKIEIITNKETNIKREITIGKTKIIVRKPSGIDINKENEKYVIFIELILKVDDSVLNKEKNFFVNYIKTEKINQKQLTEIASQYESFKALKKILKSGVMNYVTQ